MASKPARWEASMGQSYEQLTRHFRKVNHLAHVTAITSWDEAVMMPMGGGEARAEAMGTMSAMMHELLTSPKVAELLGRAHEEPNLGPWEQANLRLMGRAYRQAACLPGEFVEAMTRAQLLSEQAWRKLRAANDWPAFKPHLEE